MPFWFNRALDRALRPVKDELKSFKEELEEIAESFADLFSYSRRSAVGYSILS